LRCAMHARRVRSGTVITNPSNSLLEVRLWGVCRTRHSPVKGKAGRCHDELVEPGAYGRAVGGVGGLAGSQWEVTRKPHKKKPFLRNTEEYRELLFPLLRSDSAAAPLVCFEDNRIRKLIDCFLSMLVTEFV
jgi:hypothetical protein